ITSPSTCRPAAGASGGTAMEAIYLICAARGPQVKGNRYAATVHRELPVGRANHGGISSLRPSSLLDTTDIPTLGRRASWCGKGALPFGGTVSTLNMRLRHNKPFKLTARFRAVGFWTFEAPQLKGDR